MPEWIEIDPESAAAGGPLSSFAPSPYFAAPDFYSMRSNDKGLTIIGEYPTYQQTKGYSCGPSAVLTILWHFGVTHYDEDTLVKLCGTLTKPNERGEGGRRDEAERLAHARRELASLEGEQGDAAAREDDREHADVEDGEGGRGYHKVGKESPEENPPLRLLRLLFLSSGRAFHDLAIIGFRRPQDRRACPKPSLFAVF